MTTYGMQFDANDRKRVREALRSEADRLRRSEVLAKAGFALVIVGAAAGVALNLAVLANAVAQFVTAKW